jgi:hypothetical protein
MFGVAVTVMIPLADAHPQKAQNGQGNAHCWTWDALRGKCAKDNPNTDDILDHPNLYTGRVATLEGRVNDIYSPTTFTMQDNYDLIKHGDRILMISVMPFGARSTTATQYRTSTTSASGAAIATSATTTRTTDLNAPVPAIEMVQLLQKGFKKGKIVRATGTVRMFDRAALEQEFGPIDFGSAPLDKFQNKPVLILGAREFAEYQRQQRVEQQAAVIPPQPPAPPSEVPPAPQPEAVTPAQPEAAPPEAAPEQPVQPTPEAPTTLPRTASPIPLLGLSGLLALLLGIGFRLTRSHDPQ